MKIQWVKPLISGAILAGILLLAARNRTNDGGELPFVAHADGGFHKGECTWYAYQRAQDDGWRPVFDRGYGRHANAWCERVVNCRREDTPSVGSIAVFDAWPGNPYGHVAYVESVDEHGKWTATHANFAVGDLLGKRDGVPIYRVTLEHEPNGERLAGTRRVFRIRAFLRPIS